MESINLTPEDSEVTVDVSIERLYDELGRQGILGDNVERAEFFYLAALALECREDESYDIQDTLIEFIRNSGELEHVSMEESGAIEQLLR